MNEKKWLKIGEVSKLYGVHPDTIRRWHRSGKIQAIKTPSGFRRFDAQMLLSAFTSEDSMISSEETLDDTPLSNREKEMKVKPTRRRRHVAANEPEIPIIIESENGDDALKTAYHELQLLMENRWGKVISDAAAPFLPHISRNVLYRFLDGLLRNPTYQNELWDPSNPKYSAHMFYLAICDFNQSFSEYSISSSVFRQTKRSTATAIKNRIHKVQEHEFWLGLLENLETQFELWWQKRQTSKISES